MNIAQRLKCSISATGNSEAYYATLSESQLEAKLRSTKNLYVVNGIAWGTALGLTLLFGVMDTPLLILYSGAVIGTLFMTVVTYREERKKILKALRSKRK